MKTKKWRYTVVGSYNFPIDMLRYDRAYPDTELDSGLITNTYSRFTSITEKENRQISIIGEKEPTVGRWQSFGWGVINVRPF